MLSNSWSGQAVLFRRYNPDIFVSTDFMPNYTLLIFSVPKDKSGLFKKTQPKDETALSMPAWFGDFRRSATKTPNFPTRLITSIFTSPTLTAVRTSAPSKHL